MISALECLAVTQAKASEEFYCVATDLTEFVAALQLSN
jgi:hypothetical protein